MQNKRIVLIDELKAVGMFLVILGHVNTPSHIQSLIYAFHMPLFFLLSGATICNEKILHSTYTELFKKVCMSYLVPYLWLQFYLMPIWFIRTYVLGTGEVSFSHIIKGMFLGNTQFYPFVASTTWFVLCLLCARLIYIVIVKISAGDMKTIFCLSLLCALFGYTEKDRAYPWHFNVAFVAVLFLFLGNRFLHFYQRKVKDFPARKKLLLAIVFFAVGIVAEYFNHGISMNHNHFGLQDSLLLFYVMSISLSVCVALFFMCLPDVRFLCYIGKNTFLYMALHAELISLVFTAFPNLKDNYVFNFVFAGALFLGIAPVCFFVNWWHPFIVGRKYEAATGTYARWTGEYVAVFLCVLVPCIMAVQPIIHGGGVFIIPVDCIFNGSFHQ